MTNLLNGITDQDWPTWRNEIFKFNLRENIVLVTFIKKDGTERKMRCTLRPDFLPTQTDIEEAVQKKTPNPEVLAVWDLDSQGWRSFRYDSIIGFTVES